MALSLRYLCPKWVYFLGLGAISAATMSTADSCILAASSLFTSNVYKAVIRPHAGERELLWCIRIVMTIVGTTGVILAIVGKSVYLLSLLSNELPYLVTFPQLICLLYFDFTNTYGAIAGYVTGLFFRFGGAEQSLNWPGFISYPGNYIDDEDHEIQWFPVKTFGMICDFTTVVTVSLLTRYLLEEELSPTEWMSPSVSTRNMRKLTTKL